MSFSGFFSTCGPQTPGYTLRRARGGVYSGAPGPFECARLCRPDGSGAGSGEVSSRGDGGLAKTGPMSRPHEARKWTNIGAGDTSSSRNSAPRRQSCAICPHLCPTPNSGRLAPAKFRAPAPPIFPTPLLRALNRPTKCTQPIASAVAHCRWAAPSPLTSLSSSSPASWRSSAPNTPRMGDRRPRAARSAYTHHVLAATLG